MPRLTFPNGEDRLIYQTGISPGSALLNVNGTKFNVYLDLACTTLANIQNADGTANPGSQIIVDNQSNLPIFLGPDDATDVLFLRVDQALGNGYRIHARYDDQLDSVEALNLTQDSRLEVLERDFTRNFLYGGSL